MRSRLSIRGFLGNTKGFVAVLFGMTVPLLITIAGSGVDLARRAIVEQKISQALDAASLSAALLPPGTSIDARNDSIRKYFSMNFPNNFMGTTVTAEQISITYLPSESDPQMIDISVNSYSPTTFLGMAGVNTLGVKSKTVVSATFIPTYLDLDIVTVVDGSGSMDPHEADLEAALHSMLDPFLVPFETGEVDSTLVQDKVRFAWVEFSTNIRRSRALRMASETWRHRGFVNGYYASGGTDGGEAAERGYNLLINGPVRPSDGLQAATKVFIFMTDGVFNSPSKSSSEALFTSTCNTLKAEGAIVYTIGYEPIYYGGEVNEALLSACATDASRFILATDGLQLIEAFKKVGADLSNIKIVQ